MRLLHMIPPICMHGEYWECFFFRIPKINGHPIDFVYACIGVKLVVGAKAKNSPSLPTQVKFRHAPLEPFSFFFLFPLLAPSIGRLFFGSGEGGSSLAGLLARAVRCGVVRWYRAGHT